MYDKKLTVRDLIKVVRERIAAAQPSPKHDMPYRKIQRELKDRSRGGYLALPGISYYVDMNGLKMYVWSDGSHRKKPQPVVKKGPAVVSGKVTIKSDAGSTRVPPGLINQDGRDQHPPPQPENT